MAKKKDDEKAYEVKDKRRVNPDGSLKKGAKKETPPKAVEEPTVHEPSSEAAAEQAEQTPQAEQAAGAPGPEVEMPPPNIFDTLQFMTGLLAEQAWQLMGIHLPQGRKEPVTDMVQAKIAIDVVVSIADKLHPHLDEESRRAIRGIITDLQMNFVQHSK